MKKPALMLAVASLVLSSSVWAEPTFDPMFSDHMVLQREMPVPIWGTADPGEKVTVSFRDQKKETTADEDGKWSIKLDPLKVGRPGKLTVAGKTTLVLSDVLVGEVWLGSGQSNMSRSVSRFAAGDAVLAAMAKAGPYPDLRLYKGDWKIAAADDIGGFSAIMFAFGVPLQKELDEPVGLIVGAVSGTASGRWLSPEMLLDDPGLKKLLESDESGKTLLDEIKAYPITLAKWEEAARQAEADGKPVPEKPQPPGHIGDLHARFIEPVVPYAIRGVIWDQGEHGMGVPGVYHQFPVMHALIRGWRKAWGQGDIPFLCVQKPSGGGCAWDAQGRAQPPGERKLALRPGPTGRSAEDGGRDHLGPGRRHPSGRQVELRAAHL
jgi:sialate O-acetylesterase